MKIFFWLACCVCMITSSFAQFDDLSYDMRSEEVLKTFDIEPEFLNNPD